MKNLLLALALLIFIPLTEAGAASPDWVWAKNQVSGGTYNDDGSYVVTDGSGNVFVCGVFASPTIDLGIGSLTNTLTGKLDIFLAKYDPSGSIIWSKKFGGRGDDTPTSLQLDANGNIVMGGFFKSDTLDFGSGLLLNAGTLTLDIFIAKFDPSGNIIWSKSAGGAEDDHLYGMAVDHAGDIIVSGDFASSSIDLGSGPLTNAGVTDIYMAKFDPSGSIIFSNSFGGALSEQSYSITTNDSNDIFIAGSFQSTTLDFGSGNLPVHGGLDIFTAKFSSNGILIWEKSIGGSTDDEAFSIACDPSGGAAVTGYFRSTNIVFGNDTILQAGLIDSYIMRFDANGQADWSHSIGGVSYEFGDAICSDLSGNYYVVGGFQSPILLIGNVSLTGIGGDIFIVKYSLGGIQDWAKGAGGSGYDEGYSINANTSGNVLITGLYSAPSISLGADTLDNSGANDFFIAELGSTNGIEENFSTASLRLYPNPAKQELVLQGTKSDRLISICDLSGKIIKSGYSTETETRIELGVIESGFYILTYEDEKTRKSIPFMVAN